MMERLRAETPTLSSVPLVGIIKEVAPTKTADTDEKLGVAEFQKKYFSDPLYLDEENNFYKALGSRKLSLPSWNPFKLWSGWKKLTARLKSKPEIEGNMVGEGLVQGGVLVIGPGSMGVVHTYLEETGRDPDTWLPAVREAVQQLA
mmetsp:Transcript_63093/g.150397  ORF Transcript_63093/g.150397 Transcript_63093/m.150397 type:complete len:146 (-) Transcript_63093:99-536(-)